MDITGAIESARESLNTYSCASSKCIFLLHAERSERYRNQKECKCLEVKLKRKVFEGAILGMVRELETIASRLPQPLPPVEPPKKKNRLPETKNLFALCGEQSGD